MKTEDDIKQLLSSAYANAIMANNLVMAQQFAGKFAAFNAPTEIDVFALNSANEKGGK